MTAMIPVPSVHMGWDDETGATVSMNWRGNEGGVAVIIACSDPAKDPEETDACWAYGDATHGYGTTGTNFWLKDGIPEACVAKIIELTT